MLCAASHSLFVSLVTTHVTLAVSGSSLLVFLLYLTEASSCQWKEQGFRCRGRGAGPLPSHRCLSKDKYWLWTVLITSLNWAILLFPVGSLWKIHAGFRWEAAEEGWAWRAINHRRYIIHWKHGERTRQDGPDHWKQHFHRSVHEEDEWRCALPLRQFCYNIWPKLTVIFTDSEYFVRQGSGMLGQCFWHLVDPTLLHWSSWPAGNIITLLSNRQLLMGWVSAWKISALLIKIRIKGSRWSLSAEISKQS